MTPRTCLCCFGLLLLLSCERNLSADATGDSVRKVTELLAGEWETVSRIQDGTKLPNPEGAPRRVIIRDGKFTVKAGDKSFGTGSFAVDPAKKPIAIDMKLNLQGGKEVT